MSFDSFPAHKAAYEGDVIDLEEKLKNDPSLASATNHDGDTPLHMACWGKQLGAVGALIGYNSDVDAVGCYGRTPLHYAVHEGRQISVPLVMALLQYGADPDIADNNGYKPDDWARVDMVEGLPDVLRAIEESRKERGKR